MENRGDDFEDCLLKVKGSGSKESDLDVLLEWNVSVGHMDDRSHRHSV